MNRIIQSQLTAKTAAEVKAWVTNKPHHSGRWTDAKKREPRRPSDATHFELYGVVENRSHRIRIPLDVHALTYLKPSEREGFMYDWDDEAEKKALIKAGIEKMMVAFAVEDSKPIEQRITELAEKTVALINDPDGRRSMEEKVKQAGFASLSDFVQHLIKAQDERSKELSNRLQDEAALGALSTLTAN